MLARVCISLLFLKVVFIVARENEIGDEFLDDFWDNTVFRRIKHLEEGLDEDQFSQSSNILTHWENALAAINLKYDEDIKILARKLAETTWEECVASLTDYLKSKEMRKWFTAQKIWGARKRIRVITALKKPKKSKILLFERRDFLTEDQTTLTEGRSKVVEGSSFLNTMLTTPLEETWGLFQIKYLQKEPEKKASKPSQPRPIHRPPPSSEDLPKSPVLTRKEVSLEEWLSVVENSFEHLKKCSVSLVRELREKWMRAMMQAIRKYAPVMDYLRKTKLMINKCSKGYNIRVGEIDQVYQHFQKAYQNAFLSEIENFRTERINRCFHNALVPLATIVWLPGATPPANPTSLTWDEDFTTAVDEKIKQPRRILDTERRKSYDSTTATMTFFAEASGSICSEQIAKAARELAEKEGQCLNPILLALDELDFERQNRGRIRSLLESLQSAIFGDDPKTPERVKTRQPLNFPFGIGKEKLTEMLATYQACHKEVVTSFKASYPKVFEVKKEEQEKQEHSRFE